MRLDASYNLCSKLRSKLIFFDEIVAILVLPDHFTILPAFSSATYGGYTLRSEIEAPLITREVLPETYFLLVIMAAGAQARPFLQFQASC